MRVAMGEVIESNLVNVAMSSRRRFRMRKAPAAARASPAAAAPQPTLSAADLVKHEKTFVGLDQLKRDLRGTSSRSCSISRPVPTRQGG